MSHREGLFQWMEMVSSHLPCLSRSQIVVLSLYSYGMVMTGWGGITSVVDFLSVLLDKKADNLRQQLREWCYDAPDKRGNKRQEINVTVCFTPLLGWIISWWAAGERRIALAMDATHLRQTFTVLAISVVYRGCAIPVAWTIVRSSQPGSWQPHWLGLLDCIAPAIPNKWQVVVLTDRGLYAKWLFEAIRGQGWHPFMRINVQGQFRRTCGGKFRSLKTLVRVGMQPWIGRAVCFKTPKSQLACTLLAQWESGYTDPWLIVTDLPPNQAEIAWYGMRSWIEAGFKDIKRGGWRWEQTKMQRPERAERLWMVMAVASLWAISVGGEVDAAIQASSLLDFKRHTRRLSCFKQGRNRILAHAIRGDLLPFGHFIPEPWPSAPP